MTADILEAARAIRPYIYELIEPPDEARIADEQLARLLADARSDADVRGGVTALLLQRPATRNWAARFIEDGLPPGFTTVPERTVGSSTYSALPGYGTVTSAARFACPQDDYVWWQRAAGQPVPPCPTHGPGLVRS